MHAESEIVSSRYRKILIVVTALVLLLAIGVVIAHRKIQTDTQNQQLRSLQEALLLYQGEARERSPTITTRQLLESQFQLSPETFFGPAINDFGRVQWSADHKAADRDPLFFRRVGSSAYVVLRNGVVVWDADHQLLKQTGGELKMGPD